MISLFCKTFNASMCHFEDCVKLITSEFYLVFTNPESLYFEFEKNFKLNKIFTKE